MIFIFPGQGSQFVGMGKSLFDNFYVSKAVFDEVDDALGCKLSHLIFNGPIEELTITENAQPALMTVSMAAMRAVEYITGGSLAEMGVRYFAGHSVGECTALCASGAISLRTAAELLQIRGKSMRMAVSSNTAGMVALIGGSLDEVAQVVDQAAKYGICEIANDNGGSQIVVSGDHEALAQLPSLIKNTGIKKAIRLKVSGPFHSSLMEPAKIMVDEFLKTVVIGKPCLPIISNVSATSISDPVLIKNLITQQIVNRVRWHEMVLYAINQDVRHFVEVGAGSVLTNLIKRIDPSVAFSNIETSEHIGCFADFVLMSA